MSQVSLPPAIRAIRASFTFMTRIPVGGFPYPEETWRWCGAWFPLVGAALGGLLAGVWTLALAGGLAPASAATLVLISSALLTGALHEDGLADSADALGSGARGERLFAILKDSRIGSFGVTALLLSLLLQQELMVQAERATPGGILLIQSLSRLVPVLLLVSLPYLTEQGVSKSGALASLGGAQAGVAVATTLPLLLLCLQLELLTLHQLAGALLATLLVGLGFGWYLERRTGGVTGDFLGASQQLSTCGAWTGLILGGSL